MAKTQEWQELTRITQGRQVVVERVRLGESGAAVEGAWELPQLARLSAEDQVFVIAADQVGVLPPGMPVCHGHSMIIDPWGSVLIERTDPSPGVVIADLDFELQRRVRLELPVLANRRPGTYASPR